MEMSPYKLGSHENTPHKPTSLPNACVHNDNLLSTKLGTCLIVLSTAILGSRLVRLLGWTFLAHPLQISTITE